MSQPLGTTIPASSIAAVLANLDLSTPGRFPVTAMAIDLSGNAWLDPYARPSPFDAFAQKPDPDPEPYISVKKSSNGYKVDMTHADKIVWVPISQPDHQRGYDWLKVFQFWI
jgi:hypothetical protein